MRSFGGVTLSWGNCVSTFDLWNLCEGYEKKCAISEGSTVMVLLIFSSKGNSQLTSSVGGVAIKWNGPVGVWARGGGGGGGERPQLAE